MKCMSAIFPERTRAAQRGFAPVVAAFILVVLGGLGIVMVTLFSGQQRASAYDVLGSQAFQAARSGLEVGAFRALNGNCGATNFTMGAFTVEVGCAASQHVEGDTTTNVFRITATACNRTSCPEDAGDSYIERQLRAAVVDVPAL
jgi:MSHA biogenesis protein MshP